MAQSRIWKGSISFGLLNIPVTLQTAREDKDLHFSMLDKKDLAPIKFRRVNANTGREVSYQQIVKGYKHQDNEFVVITPADLKAANPKATQTIDIEDFVDAEAIDPMLFDMPYYLVPQKGGEKGYFLLRDALAKSKKVAVGKVVLRTKQHLSVIMPRGDYLVLEILRFAHEVLEANDVKYLDDVDQSRQYTPREMKMAQELIDGMTSEWEPSKYKDTYYDDVMKRIKAKIRAGRIHEVTEFEESADEPEEPQNLVDLLPLLRRSLKERQSKRKNVSAKRHV